MRKPRRFGFGPQRVVHQASRVANTFNSRQKHQKIHQTLTLRLRCAIQKVAHLKEAVHPALIAGAPPGTRVQNVLDDAKKTAHQLFFIHRFARDAVQIRVSVFTGRRTQLLNASTTGFIVKFRFRAILRVVSLIRVFLYRLREQLVELHDEPLAFALCIAPFAERIQLGSRFVHAPTGRVLDETGDVFGQFCNVGELLCKRRILHRRTRDGLLRAFDSIDNLRRRVIFDEPTLRCCLYV